VDERPGASRTGPAPAVRETRGRGGGGILRQIAELPLLILFAFVIAVVIKTFLVQAFYIPSGSMLPTLHVSDRVLVEKLSYLVDDPSRGDVIVFARSALPGPQPDLPWTEDARNFLRELLGLPTGSEEDYIKRVVATEGDVIAYSGQPRVLRVNGEPVDEPYLKTGKDQASTSLAAKDCERLRMDAVDGGCRLRPDTVFVMGDNRANSQDSRFIGPIDEDKIVGRAFVIIWPPGDFAGL
jgi:signal peptidase I